MLGAGILLLDSGMEQKGVDGFSLSVSPFHIQQIRAAGCCGDHAEEGSAHLHHQRQPPTWAWAVLGQFFAVGNTTTTTTTTTKRVKEKGGREVGRGKQGGRKGREHIPSCS